MSGTRVVRRVIGLSMLWSIGMLAGCGGGTGPAGAGPAPAIVVDGSSTVYRISMAARDSYNLVEPTTVVVVDYHGTGAGFSRYMEGEIDIVDASRAAKPAEEAKAKAQGIDWSRFLVGYDGITLVVNPKNDFVKSLTVEQLKTIWGPASKVMNWKDLDRCLAGPQDHSLFAGRRFRDVRVFHRGDRGQIEEPA